MFEFIRVSLVRLQFELFVFESVGQRRGLGPKNPAFHNGAKTPHSKIDNSAPAIIVQIRSSVNKIHCGRENKKRPKTGISHEKHNKLPANKSCWVWILFKFSASAGEGVINRAPGDVSEAKRAKRIQNLKLHEPGSGRRPGAGRQPGTCRQYLGQPKLRGK
jgi:hypothetical protein